MPANQRAAPTNEFHLASGLAWTPRFELKTWLKPSLVIPIDMPQANYPPALAKSEFNCAQCGVFAAQVWYVVAGRQGNWLDDQGAPQPHSIYRPDGGSRHFAIGPFNTTQLGVKVGMSVGGKAQSIPPGENDLVLHAFYASVCFHCGAPSLWHLDRMVYPTLGGVEAPNPDLRQDIRDDYREAASVFRLPLELRQASCACVCRSSASSLASLARTSTTISLRWSQRA
jgi:hypothetical protein